MLDLLMFQGNAISGNKWDGERGFLMCYHPTEGNKSASIQARKCRRGPREATPFHNISLGKIYSDTATRDGKVKDG